MRGMALTKHLNGDREKLSNQERLIRIDQQPKYSYPNQPLKIEKIYLLSFIPFITPPEVGDMHLEQRIAH